MREHLIDSQAEWSESSFHASSSQSSSEIQKWSFCAKSWSFQSSSSSRNINSILYLLQLRLIFADKLFPHFSDDFWRQSFISPVTHRHITTKTGGEERITWSSIRTKGESDWQCATLSQTERLLLSPVASLFPIILLLLILCYFRLRLLSCRLLLLHDHHDLVFCGVWTPRDLLSPVISWRVSHLNVRHHKSPLWSSWLSDLYLLRCPGKVRGVSISSGGGSWRSASPGISFSSDSTFIFFVSYRKPSWWVGRWSSRWWRWYSERRIMRKRERDERKKWEKTWSKRSDKNKSIEYYFRVWQMLLKAN